jgi:hypothetical protein
MIHTYTGTTWNDDLTRKRIGSAKYGGPCTTDCGRDVVVTGEWNKVVGIVAGCHTTAEHNQRE